MLFSHFYCAVRVSRFRGIVIRRLLQVFIIAATIVVAVSGATAQVQPAIIEKGDAVVTGYSGIALLQPPKNADPEDYAIINQQGATLQVFDLSQMFGRDDARLVNAPRRFSVAAGEIGQVFGVALDDGADAPDKRKIPNIYATATSMFGLQIVKTIKGVRNRAKTGGADRSWMDGQFGASLGGGPGSIYKIDGRTGEVSLFADVVLNGRRNSGPALGNIAFDPASRQLFVSDQQTGMIHAFDLRGVEVAIFDHGRNGRPKLGLKPAAYDPSSRVEITDRAFKAADPRTWGLASKERRVWGLAVHQGRLYYAVAEGPEIWSVGIRKNDGRFAGDARVEVEVRAPNADAISDISISSDGTMYASQRGQAESSYNYATFAKPATAAVLRYRKQKLPGGRVVWQPVPDEYAVGFPGSFRNTNGGVALGYGYDRFGFLRYDACEAMLWSTGERLRQGARFKSQLTAGGPLVVHGLQGNSPVLVRPSNEGPFKSYFIDYDSNHFDPAFRGHMGDVAIWSDCAGGVGVSNNRPPAPPAGPSIRLAKSCSSASFGGRLHCRITLTNSGDLAPTGRVGFNDAGKILSGPSAAGAVPLLISAEPDDQAWRCSSLPANDLSCSIDGSVLEPGHHHSVDVVMDISALVATPKWRIRNCARLDGADKSRCVTRGESDALVVTKSGPDPQTCIAGGPCDFTLTVRNPGRRSFDGPLMFGDNLSVGGALKGGISVDGINPTQGCTITGTSLPLQWRCHVTIPPRGRRTFRLLLTIPKGAGPASGTVTGRNCFVAAEPKLLQTAGNKLPANFWGNALQPGGGAPSPGMGCVNFAIKAAAPNQDIPERIIPITLPPTTVFGNPMPLTVKLTVTPDKDFFDKDGELITFRYQVQNTSTRRIKFFEITDNRISPGKPIGRCDRSDIPAGGFATCLHDYITKPSDKNGDIFTAATVTGN